MTMVDVSSVQRILKPVEMTAALGSGSAPPPSLPQPRPRAPRLILGSAPSPFEATRQPSSGPPKATDLRPNPLTGMAIGLAMDVVGDAVSWAVAR